MSKKYPVYKSSNKEVKVVEKLLPLGFPNRTGEKQIPEYIVIHEVSLGIGKSPEIFNMERYANKILNDGIDGSDIGYHFLVGDKEIYQFIREDEITMHTGTEKGNHNSIGVERLICEGVNYNNAISNQAKLIATLMVKWNIPFDHVITHKGMQVMYGAPKSAYKISIKDNKSEIELQKSSKELSDYYIQTVNNTINLCNQIFNNNLISSDNEKTITKWLIVKNKLVHLKQLEYNLNSFSRKRQISEIYNLLSYMVEINKFISNKTGCHYEKLNVTVDGINFVEQQNPKQCPNRLIAGQYGGLEQFKREIQRCLEYKWFYTELLSNELCHNLGIEKEDSEINKKR